jgi:hypothetical protein
VPGVDDEHGRRLLRLRVLAVPPSHTPCATEVEALPRRASFDYRELVAAAGISLLKKYTRLRRVELALCDPLHEAVTDAALNFAARRVGIRERGEWLYEHEDYSVLLELATYHHRMRGKTVIERHFEATKPTVGTDEHLVLTAMMISRFTLLRLGEPTPGVGVRALDLLFGGDVLVADIQLSKYREDEDVGETVIATRLLAFDDFAMTPCTSYLPVDPELARMLAAGLPKESTVPMAKRYASAEAKLELAMEVTEMALCSVESVREGLIERFGLTST